MYPTYLCGLTLLLYLEELFHKHLIISNIVFLFSVSYLLPSNQVSYPCCTPNSSLKWLQEECSCKFCCFQRSGQSVQRFIFLSSTKYYFPSYFIILFNNYVYYWKTDYARFVFFFSWVLDHSFGVFWDCFRYAREWWEFCLFLL